MISVLNFMQLLLIDTLEYFRISFRITGIKISS
jgi:hypothetical protein